MTAAPEARPIRPAATAIVMREPAGSPPELLMIRRSTAIVFAGAWVFPGGQIDAGDRALAEATAADGLDLDPEDRASRIAAIRETIEEAACPIGLDPIPDPDRLIAMRAALHRGEPLATLLADHGLRLALDRLVPFSRWITPPNQAKRFDTRFYLARAEGDAACEPDGTETAETMWVTAEKMLELGAGDLIFPTALSLHRLALHADFEAAAAHSALQSPDPVIPKMLEIDGERYLTVPEGWGFPDIRYPITGRR